MNEPSIFYPENQAAWRKWLEENHQTERAVWVVFHTKSSKRATLSWSHAVDEALCFGWIDSKKIKIDTETSHQFFSKRKPQSTWSKINKEKIERLHEHGLMAASGLESVALAKQNGSWTILDTVEELIIPQDLESAFENYDGSKDYFLSLSKSSRKMMLAYLGSPNAPKPAKNALPKLRNMPHKK